MQVLIHVIACIMLNINVMFMIYMYFTTVAGNGGNNCTYDYGGQQYWRQQHGFRDFRTGL